MNTNDFRLEEHTRNLDSKNRCKVKRQKWLQIIETSLLIAILASSCAEGTQQTGTEEDLFSSSAWTESEYIDDKENSYSDATLLTTEIMNYYDNENDIEIISEEILAELPLPSKRSAVFYYYQEELEIILYVENDSATSYVLINGQKLILSQNNLSFYLRDGSNPEICLYDINGDGILDILLSCQCDRIGMVQNVYISTGDSQYTELGNGVIWDMNKSYERFPYQISLLKNYEVLVEMEEYGIYETTKLNDEFKPIAIALGLYDNKGNLTDYGKTWTWDFNQYRAPFEKKIVYKTDEDGQLIIQVIAPIGAGYSSYLLGGRFIFYWTIQENEYQLLNIDFFCE